MAIGSAMPARGGGSRGRDILGMVLGASLPALAVAGALLIGAVMLLLLDADPVRAYGALVEGAFGSSSGLTQSLVKATPLLLVGLGICIAFRASVINIGAEGQIILGAVAATWFALEFRTAPGWVLIPGAIGIGFLAGAFWGFVPGILKARMGVNEILTTVMMNAIALQFMNFMIRGPLIDPAGVSAGQYLAQSEKIPEQAWLMRLVPQTLLHAGIFVALALAVVTYVFLWRTTIGYRIRAVGLNPDASRYAGIRVPVYQALSLTLAGGLAGVAGAVEVLGVQHRLLDGITSGYGFSGIVTALFGG
ncbi:MAG: ABC transporter permease, partial [Chloroflexi bacterium]|nr:ABC transporter permease [Chloroflexota bacterium]